ncbi:MAG: NAD(P)-dependent glycerol-3-phosphate dehydrogenase [Phycisphaeraceae bacterium]|nr:NAD(P)-dependent glycerol-3-phosphate dehydrogenase [Phycisphaeraceae bacterium]MCW5763011.1 NAD(P)-dependent glycerol-3-phosphate dehydrogenase [Phycisphaeraceae bacterium]
MTRAQKSGKLPAFSRTCVLGLGQMGLVSAGLLAGTDRTDPGHAPEVVMWGHSEDEAGLIVQTRSSRRLPGFVLPDAVRVALTDADALEGVDLVVVAIPVQFIRSVFERLRSHIPRGAAMLSVAKGIENKTLLRPTQIMADVLADDMDAAPRPLGVLSGPTIATELARRLPATMVVASDAPGFSQRVQQLFSASWLRVYTNDDMLGVELAGAMKNVIAIAAGIIDGLGAGSNAKSALLARGLAEITRLGTAMGASSATFFGIAGVGDLATTCFSPEGRNRSLGEALGRGARLATYLAESPFVVEGVATTKSVVDLAQRFRVEMPIVEATHAVLFEGLDPIDAIGMLMSRDLKSEQASER